MGIFLPKKQAKRSGNWPSCTPATGAKRLTQAPRPHIMPSMETKEKNLGGLIGNIFRIFRPDGDGVEFWVRAETEVRGEQK